MRAEIKAGLAVIIPENDEEKAFFLEWRTVHEEHVFILARNGALYDLGQAAEACRQPINISFTDGDPRWRVISNLAPTPFVLRGRQYASVEGFWQGLKFEDETERGRVAELAGPAAKFAGRRAPRAAGYVYEGASGPFGGPRHHRLMFEACWAKFSQNAEARTALLSTGDRPLTHRMRRDSETIPGALLADIWMRIRARLRNGESAAE